MHFPSRHGFASLFRLASSRALFVIVVGSVGCASALRRGTEAGVGGTLDAVSDPENQALIEDIGQSEDVQNTSRLLAASVTRGVIQGLSQELGPNAEDGLATTATSMMSRLGASTEEIMRENVAPGVAAVARETLNASLATAASDQNIERSQRIVGATTDAAVRAMTAALADGIRHDLVPAIGEARARAQPAAIQLLSDPAFHQALGSIVREVSREAVLGTEEALDTIGKNKDPNQDGSLLGGLATRFAGATAIFLLIGIVIVGLIVFLLVRQARSRRRAAREAAQRREELMMSFVGMAVSNLDLTDEQKAEAERLGLFRMPGTGAGPDSDRRHRPAAGGQFQPEFG